jgi:hypothetical protein
MLFQGVPSNISVMVDRALRKEDISIWLRPEDLDSYRLLLAKLFNDGICNERGLSCNSWLEINPQVICECHTNARLSKDTGTFLVSGTSIFKSVHCIDIFLNYKECCILYGWAKGLHCCKMLTKVETLYGPDV